MSRSNSRSSKDKYGSNNRRRIAGRSQAFRPQQTMATSKRNKRPKPSNGSRNADSKSTGTHRVTINGSRMVSTQRSIPEERVGAFFEKKKVNQADLNLSARRQATGPHEWVVKHQKTTTKKDSFSTPARGSFSSIVSGDQSNKENEPGNVSHPNQRSPMTNHRRVPKPSAGKLSNLQARSTGNHSGSSHVQAVQRRPPLQQIQTPMQRGLPQSPRAHPFLPQVIQPKVNENLVISHQSQIEDLKNQLHRKTAEIVRLQAQASKADRELKEERRLNSDRKAEIERKLQRVGMDPETLETMATTEENQDRVLFLGERLGKYEEECAHFQKSQKELLDQIKEQRFLWKQFMNEWKKKCGLPDTMGSL